MGYVGKLEEKQKAINLRRQGFSYKEILKEVHVSKDTISRWCKDIILSEEQKKRILQNKLNGQRKGSIIAAENKRKKRLSDITLSKRAAKKDIKRISQRDVFLTGVALYAGEGTKNDRHVAFTNADPNLIKFMTKWFIVFTKVSPIKLRARIWLHEGLDEKEAKMFWSRLINIPEKQFIKTYFAKKKENSKKVRKNIHKYGVISVYFSDTVIHRRIMGWISALFGDKIAI